jgi:hypothetical protein
VNTEIHKALVDNHLRLTSPTCAQSGLIRFARPELEKARGSTDREVARRAKALLDQEAADADRRADTLLAVLREVGRRKTAGAVSALLDVFPLCERPDLRQAAGQGLATVARPADTEILRQALKSPDPHIRTAAVAAYDAALGDKAREELGRLLEDRDDRVRLVTALALLNRGDREALPALGMLLESPNLPIRNRAGHVLRAVTGKDTGFVAYRAPEERATAAEEWRRWIEGHGRTVLGSPDGPHQHPLAVRLYLEAVLPWLRRGCGHRLLPLLGCRLLVRFVRRRLASEKAPAESNHSHHQ